MPNNAEADTQMVTSTDTNQWQTTTSAEKDVPQGSPLSPLLSNILLDELDKELKRRRLRFVRYADDFSIYTKSKKSATKR